MAGRAHGQRTVGKKDKCKKSGPIISRDPCGPAAAQGRARGTPDRSDRPSWGAFHAVDCAADALAWKKRLASPARLVARRGTRRAFSEVPCASAFFYGVPPASSVLVRCANPRCAAPFRSHPKRFLRACSPLHPSQQNIFDAAVITACGARQTCRFPNGACHANPNTPTLRASRSARTWLFALYPRSRADDGLRDQRRGSGGDFDVHGA